MTAVWLFIGMVCFVLRLVLKVDFKSKWIYFCQKHVLVHLYHARTTTSDCVFISCMCL